MYKTIATNLNTVKHAQLLSALAETAETTGASVSDIVKDALREYFKEPPSDAEIAERLDRIEDHLLELIRRHCDE